VRIRAVEEKAPAARRSRSRRHSSPAFARAIRGCMARCAGWESCPCTARPGRGREGCTSAGGAGGTPAW
jgi:hypothetical protein